jgi:predicted helicase
MALIQPYFLNKIKEYMFKGYNLVQILEEYNDNGIFEDYIKANYYHLNNGPDLRDYQAFAVEEAKCVFFTKKLNNYKLFWCCGLGKTKTALTIAKQLHFKTILIIVPSILLLDQFSKDLNYFYPLSTIIKFCSKESTDTSKLRNYLVSDNRYKIVLTTYQSSNHILNVVDRLNFVFDFVILDEAHHLHSKNSKLFSCCIDIPFTKRLILTATPYIGDETNNSLSLETSDVFKGDSNTKSVSWAIKEEYITDYNIIVLNINGELLPDILDYSANKELILAAFMALKCIYNNKSKKLLIYCNKIAHAQKVQDIIKVLLDNYSNDTNLFNNDQLTLDIGNYELNGTDSSDKRDYTLDLFRNKEYAIMSSVQLFGEGYDYPGLDSVLFAEKMESNIRIVQSALRPCRKDKSNPLKKANILLPIFDNNDTKLKQVLLRMNSVDNIIDKIEIYNTTSFTPSKKEVQYNKFELDTQNKTLLAKIELEYLKDSEYSAMYNADVTKSKILSCNISNKNTIISTSKIYRQILIDIWKTIDKEDLIKTSTFKFKITNETGEKGYNWCDQIKMSFPNKCANGCMREILNMIQINKYTINMSIMLVNKTKYDILINT